ncbi:MAG: FAD-binding oxidoreductase [Candidatus Magasanikbacteria bacterium]|nr:FAD-binding oxidoreductase [Candidatus Magasanikbacteria bacterium]
MTHEEKIKSIAEQIKVKAAAGKPLAFVKKSVPHVVPNSGRVEVNEKIYIGDLDQVIKIDAINKTCTAESGVTFYDLVKKTLSLGLVPFVVPELKGITIGGAVSGCSIEAMSYKYGGFHDSCLAYEVISANGEVLTCSREKDPELFNMIHGSYGTLALVTKLKFKLYPAKPFVKMTYKKFSDFDIFYKYLLERCERADYEFVDAIIHGTNSFVACLGNMVDTAPYTSNYEWINIFYKSTLTRDEDYIKTDQYFFRYDADCHWLAKALPLMETKLSRLFFGKIVLGSTNMIKWAKRLAGIFRKTKLRTEVVVDVFIPSKKFPDFWRWYARDFNFFPLWIVPYKMPQGMYPWVNPSHAKKAGENFIIDAAIYGKPNNDPKIDYSEMMEQKVYELGGVKTLISRNHYTKERFAEIYNLELYNRIKQKTDPRNLFGTIYERMVR